MNTDALYLTPEPGGRFRVGDATFDNRASAVRCLWNALGIRPSEWRVLARVGCGLPLTKIAQELGLSPKTVSSQLATLRARSGTQSTLELVLWAQSMGLVEPPQPGRWAR